MKSAFPFNLLLPLLVLTSGLLHAAITPERLLFDVNADFSANASLSTLDVVEDLDYLKTAVQSGYAGPRQLLTSLNQLNALKLKISDSQSLCEVLGQVFATVLDRHLFAYLDFKACGSSSPARGNVGPNINSSDKPWSLDTREGARGQISILSIRSFPSEDDPGWHGFLEAVATLREQNRDFILDLRGNTGGDDSNGFEMARILYGFNRDTTLPTPLGQMVWSQGPVAFALQVNGWSYQIARMKNQGLTVPDYYFQRRELVRGWYERSKVQKFANPFVQSLVQNHPDARASFAKNIYVLIDGRCASSCETTLQALEALPHRILVGENSSGTVEYGNVGMLVLPHSHLAVQLSTLANRFRDHRHPEKRGYEPQIRIPAGQDALSALLSRLNSKL